MTDSRAEYRGNGARPGDEIYTVTDVKTRQLVPIRSMTDKQLALYAADVQAQFDAAKMSVVNSLHNLERVTKGLGIMQYEMDRRTRTLAIVADLPGLRTNA